MHSLGGRLCTKRVTQKGGIGYYKSNLYFRLQNAKESVKAPLEYGFGNGTGRLP